MTFLRLSLVLFLLGGGGEVSVAWGQAADSTADGPADVVERVTEAFGQGDPERLLVPSADRVEVTLFGARTFYSNAQAFYVLRDFFRSHAPRAFSVNDVTEAGTSCFVRGIYEQDRVDRPLHVFVRFGKGDEEAWRLHEIRIEDASE